MDRFRCLDHVLTSMTGNLQRNVTPNKINLPQKTPHLAEIIAKMRVRYVKITLVNGGPDGRSVGLGYFGITQDLQVQTLSHNWSMA